MEIREYVSQMGWRLWILVLLPLASGGLAFGLLADTPPQHEAQTVLTVASPVAGGSSSGSVAQYMANFQQTIISEPVVAEVAEEVTTDGEDIRQGLKTSQLGTSNLIEVSYQGPDSHKAARIVQLATRAAFSLVAEIQLAENPVELQARLRESTAELAEAETRLEDFLVENGLVLPREEYLMIAADVRRLEDDILRAEADGSSTAALEIALQERRHELGDLGSNIPEYERLQADVDRAEEDLADVQDELRLAESQLGNLEPQMTDVTLVAVSTMQTIGKGVGIAVAVGFIVGLALVVLFPSKGARHMHETVARISPSPHRDSRADKSAHENS